MKATALAVYTALLVLILVALLGTGQWELWAGAGIVLLIAGFAGSEVLHRWPT